MKLILNVFVNGSRRDCSGVGVTHIRTKMISIILIEWLDWNFSSILITIREHSRFCTRLTLTVTTNGLQTFFHNTSARSSTVQAFFSKRIWHGTNWIDCIEKHYSSPFSFAIRRSKNALSNFLMISFLASTVISGSRLPVQIVRLEFGTVAMRSFKMSTDPWA